MIGHDPEFLRAVELQMLGLDSIWQDARAEEVGPGRFAPSTGTEARDRYAEFVRYVPVHPAALVFPEAGEPAPTDDDLRARPLDSEVTVARAAGDWALIGGPRVQRASVRLGVLPVVSIWSGTVVSYVARTNRHAFTEPGARLLAAVRLHLLHVDEQRRTAPEASQARTDTAAATRDISRWLRVKVAEVRAAALAAQYGSTDLAVAACARLAGAAMDGQRGHAGSQ